ncbi:MAG: RCC1 domain-containing protein [Psychrobacter sp.]|uniref:RCC1 domain-containing protein n=1 Tax=Psychrobacter sp. TaxID=56811 RepID=UPI003F97AE55
MRLNRLTQAVACVIATFALTACGSDSDNNTVSDNTSPSLTTDSNFVDGSSAIAAAFVSGQVQDEGGIKSLTYTQNDNPTQAIALDADGSFDDSISLDLGSNTIILEATDKAGNVTRSTKTIYLGDTIAAGGSHTAALRDGLLYGWGRNNYGQTGLGSTSKISDDFGHPDTPTLMGGAPENLLSINFNQNHSLAIDQTGQVYSWGEDKYGQLGRGEMGRNDCSSTEDCRLDISAISNIDNAVMIAAGYKHNLVLTADGSVWGFGTNAQGQLGDGTSTDSSTPVQVDFSTATNVGRIVQVVASANSSYALDDKGQVWGWGSDNYANLGKGEACTTANDCVNVNGEVYGDNATPVLIDVLNNSSTTESSETSTTTEVEKVTQLAAGRDHVLALTNQESVYGWGLNASSQVGYTEEAWGRLVASPTKLPWFTDKDVRRVYANGNASYVLLDDVTTANGSVNDGVLYSWGMFGETNSEGRTNYDNLDEPTNKLSHLEDIENMAMGALHYIANENDFEPNDTDEEQNDDLFTWGWSFEGSLGNADTTHIWMYNNPIPVELPEATTNN